MAKSKRRRSPPKATRRPGGTRPSTRPATQQQAPQGPNAPAGTERSTEVAAQTADTARDARPGAREEARRQRREEARRQREIAYKRARRRAALRRGVIWAVVAAVLAGIVLFFLTRSQEAKANLEEANRFATAAGCDQIESRADQGRDHLAQGETFAYTTEPATSGPHAPGPLPPDPHVYTTPVDETQAVHNLEHGYVLIYYRPDGDQALPDDVVKRLGGFATNHDKVIMAPFAQLPAGSSLALAAWNRLETCPSTVSAEQAATMAKNFNDLFNSGGDAPEASLP